MKYRDIILRVGQPALIESAALLTLSQLANEDAATLFGCEVFGDEMEVDGGVAIVPLSGILGRGLDGIPGTTDTGEFVKLMGQIADRPDIHVVMLDIDSPGGSVAGTMEAAQAFADLPQTKISYASGLMASAAYWIGSGADEIYASPSSKVGSIGAMAAFLDISKSLEQAGIKVDVIASGKYKGMGTLGTALTPDQRDHVQTMINEMAGQFIECVSECRPNVDLDDMQGQVFTSQTAEKKGLIDGISCMDDLIAEFKTA